VRFPALEGFEVAFDAGFEVLDGAGATVFVFFVGVGASLAGAAAAVRFWVRLRFAIVSCGELW